MWPVNAAPRRRCLRYRTLPVRSRQPGQPAQAPRRLVVTFFDVGQGDSALVQTPGGKAALFTWFFLPFAAMDRNALLPERAAGYQILKPMLGEEPGSKHASDSNNALRSIAPINTKIVRSFRRL